MESGFRSDSAPAKWRPLRRLILRPGLWLALALLLSGLLPVGATAGERTVKAPTAAEVNGTAIGVQDYQRELERVKRQKGIVDKNADEARLAELKREALENLIIREILFQESVRQGITVDGPAIDREMEQLKGQFASPGQFADSLERVRMNEAVVREQVGRGLAIRALIDRSVGKGGAVTDEEADRYFEQHKGDFTRQPQVHLSHILLTLDAKATEKEKQEARDRMSALRAKLLAGEEFAALAAVNSDCQSKNRGGDIGWFAPGQLTAEVEKAVTPLKAGELSEVVEDRFGLHVIKVLERRDAFTPKPAEVREKVKGLVRQEKNLINLQRYVKGLRDAAKVELLLRDGD
jgi:parvulin-like peptidyl-prolyl isomerase